MATITKEYVVASGIGDLEQCRALLFKITDTIREQFRSQREDRRASFAVRMLCDSVETTDEGIDLDEITTFSKGFFPLLWMTFTYDPARVTELEVATLEVVFFLRVLKTFESERPFR
ncbi:MAG: hypothetical protein JNM56_21725 [Planctomycetia bacterium]|nr:hypothetical protein [Planctomycetia bacterium]